MSDGEKMLEQRKQGDTLADRCLSLYAMHRRVPEDNCARVLFFHLYEEWKQREAVASLRTGREE